MGVLNVTPDSFSDGGVHASVEAAIAHGLALVAAGADVLDVGAESTRPGHAKVAAEEQLRRLLPVVEALAARTAVPISIDTTRALVAERCLDAGAAWINDTSALREDPTLADVVAARGCPLVLMHWFTPPRRENDPPADASLVAGIAAWLEARVGDAVARGIRREQLLVDPGLGFGTRPEDNLTILAHLDVLRRLQLPLVVGPSRKSFLGRLTGQQLPAARGYATAAAVTVCALAGVDWVRVHDVAAMRDVVRVADAIRRAATGVEPPQVHAGPNFAEPQP